MRRSPRGSKFVAECLVCLASGPLVIVDALGGSAKHLRHQTLVFGPEEHEWQPVVLFEASPVDCLPRTVELEFIGTEQHGQPALRTTDVGYQVAAHSANLLTDHNHDFGLQHLAWEGLWVVLDGECTHPRPSPGE